MQGGERDLVPHESRCGRDPARHRHRTAHRVVEAHNDHQRAHAQERSGDRGGARAAIDATLFASRGEASPDEAEEAEGEETEADEETAWADRVEVEQGEDEPEDAANDEAEGAATSAPIEPAADRSPAVDPGWEEIGAEARAIVERVRRLFDQMHEDDREEAIDLNEKVEQALASRDRAAAQDAVASLKELLFFVEGK